ncbi:hypothetical protein ACFWOS_36285 [Streptomyces rubiginosohelvolus]|uniref:hypothetical protein n=1 Tax=Streptomyces TaxID=1883 RepID=UPI00190CFE29|nr:MULTISPECIES: hypothetical protein [unclassified Streptomyces]MBK3529200.1 hypothetical protein [Streptomyces sp. MBT72]MBK3535571.1 hypothetical protein [Streptomyces sp. MBT67]MBK3549505.1 hypothetical protein [Streptomyces sp. MBT61]MBK6028320.1 hypothetical protein [Streptomyces sp. MBT59]
MTPGTTTLISAESTGTPVLPHWIPAPAAIAVLLITLALVTRWLWPRARKLGGGRRPSSAAVRVAAVAAIGCTTYSADTSWRFAADYLGMDSTVERASMFAVAELALFAMALMARQNLKGPRQAPGPPGVLVWVITGGQIIPAYAESGPVGGTVRALIGPVMAAVLWHLAMGIELRHHTPEAASRSLPAILGRQARERLLARLGIHDQDADAARLIRERALSRAVTLILRIEAMPEAKRNKGRGRRATRRLHEALEKADVDGDLRQDDLLLRKLGTRQQATRLASLPLPERWETPGDRVSQPRTAAAKRARPERPEGVPNPGDQGVHRSDRPEFIVRPQSATDGGADVSAGRDAGAEPGGKPEPVRPGRKPDLPRDALIAYAERIYRETGRLSRDSLKAAVRADGHQVGTDLAQSIVNTVKAEQQESVRTGHPH